MRRQRFLAQLQYEIEHDIPEGRDDGSDRARMQRATEGQIARRGAKARQEMERTRKEPPDADSN